MALNIYLSKIKVNSTTSDCSEVNTSTQVLWKLVVSDSCCFPFLNTSTFSLQYRLHVTFILNMGWFVPSRLRDNKKHNSLTSEEGRRESWEEGNKINIYFLLLNVPRARTPYSLTAPACAFLLTARLPVTLCAKKRLYAVEEIWEEECKRYSFARVTRPNSSGRRSDR